jgi:hypothetical protein
MSLVDSNMWLERLMDQARSEGVGRFIDYIPSEKLFIADFAFHSIGVIIGKLKIDLISPETGLCPVRALGSLPAMSPDAKGSE